MAVLGEIMTWFHLSTSMQVAGLAMRAAPAQQFAVLLGWWGAVDTAVYKCLVVASTGLASGGPGAPVGFYKLSIPTYRL